MTTRSACSLTEEEQFIVYRLFQLRKGIYTSFEHMESACASNRRELLAKYRNLIKALHYAEVTYWSQ